MQSTTCEQIMTPNPDVASMDDSIDDAMKMLFHGNYRHLPVVEHKGELCPTSGNPLYPQGKKKLKGILSINDMMNILSKLIKPNLIEKANMPSLREFGRLSEKLFVVMETDPVRRAVELMAKKNVGSLVVVDGHACMTGIVTERDYLRKVILQGKTSNQVMVKDIMTPDPLCAETEISVSEALDMLSHGFRHLPLLDASGKMGPYHVASGKRCVGMLSSKDIVNYLYQQ
mmetsp:Transcript_8523/g.9699  ORF Transcript_8523/g.9699 Transcript_8523/m.9699 type:complete len:229 (-) Transcript_8523:277-963(-)